MNKRFSAIRALVETSSAFPQIFSPLLKNRNVRVHTSAAFAISSIIFSSSSELRGDMIKEAVEFFMHKDLRMQFYAAGLLGRVAASFPEALEDSMPRIIDLFRAKDFSFYIMPRAFAVGDIGFRAPQLIENLVPTIVQSLEEQELAMIALERISLRSPLLLKDYVPQLAEFLQKRQRDSRKLNARAWDATVVLARMSRISPELKQRIWTHAENLIEDKNIMVCAFASYIIGEIGLRDPGIVMDKLPRFTKLLDEEPDIRFSTALALGRISSRSPVLAEKVAPKLMKMIKDPEPLVRGAAVVSLRYMAMTSPELVKNILPNLSEMLRDKHPTMRGIAAIGLKLISLVSPDIVSDILESVSDMARETNADARRGAATAFHFLFRYFEPQLDNGLIPQIVELLGDTEPRIRDRAVMAIKNIAMISPDHVKDLIPKIVELLEDKDGNVRRDAVWTLAEFSVHYPEIVKEAAFPKLIKLLEDRNIDVYQFAALALGRLV